MTDLEKLIHQRDPYEGFDPTRYPVDTHGWGGHGAFFRPLVRQLDPQLIIEVGTWKGRSAMTMADELKKLDGGGQILCVDTWLGATEFIGAPPGDSRDVQPINGYPSVYYQFLANVVRANLSKQIVPFPQTSANAERYLRGKVKAELIYVDGSHEYSDVLDDLISYMNLLSPGGILCGDDYCEHWDGVVKAVDGVAQDFDMKVQHFQYPGEKYPSDYWVMSEKGDVKL
jgi:cephalosporin hydroxylase